MTEGTTGWHRNLPPVRARRRRRVHRPRPRPAPQQGVCVRAVGAIEEMASWSRSLLRPPRRVRPTRRVSPRLRGTRPPGRHAGTDHLLSSRAGRAADRELEPTFFSCVAISGHHDDDTSVAWGGDDEDDPDMSLQSTVALATLPLHNDSGDGSSLEEMSHSPAFRLLMRLSFRSRLAISLFMLCLARGTPPLCGRFVLVEDRLLRERHLSRNEVRAPQLQRQEDGGISRSRGPLRRPTSQRRTQINQTLSRRR
jgi:hypothetical protein